MPDYKLQKEKHLTPEAHQEIERCLDMGGISVSVKYSRVCTDTAIFDAYIKESEKYHHHFRLYDTDSKVLLTDVLEIHTLEVPKARKALACTDNAHLFNWMKFFDAKTEEELDMLAQKSPAMKKATLRLLELSADEKARLLYEARLKEQRDIYARERGARQDERFIIARNALQMKLSISDIVSLTGLSHNEIEALQEAN